jgi:hypothetical protein
MASSVQKVHSWVARPLEDILDGDPTIYDSSDPDTRQEIDAEELADLPLTDEHQQEINIYDEQGHRVPRREGRFTSLTSSEEYLGLLMNLRDLGHMFDREGNRLWENELIGRAHYYVYPQAFLGSIGHFQAHGLPSAFGPVLRAVNRVVGAPQGMDPDLTRELFGEEHDDDDDGDDTDDINEGTKSAVTGLACQGYNEVVHKMRGHGGREHEVQLGKITATLAGTYATTESGQKTRLKLHRSCSTLPHKAFEFKVSMSPDMNRNFRLENVFCIDLSKLKRSMRIGWYVPLIRRGLSSVH